MHKNNWAMWATYSRILLVPLIVIFILFQPNYWNWWATALFAMASITDWLDGYWARKYQTVSDMGKLLDPIADKVLVSSILILLIPLQRIEAIAVLILLNRDILVGGLRSMAAQKGYIMAADKIGKWKTALQMFAIPALLLYEDLSIIFAPTIGYYLLWVTVFLSLVSGAQYLINFYNHQKNF
jgi:CDP-diacylglycerol--glycerol-3-phosphate 3-phosphatidyltransferase